MKIRRLICAIATTGVTKVNADCKPLAETCAPIPGISSPIRTDFTKLATSDLPKNGWTIANHAGFRTDAKNGGVFPIEKRYDAPYIWTTGYFLYGHVDVVMQSAPGAGVITSAVLMSDTADEVDWEWSGNNYGQKSPNVQTNYFGKGITGSYDRSTSVYPGFEMTTGLHKYSIDWTAESLAWSVDGRVVRVLYRKDCDNGEHQYPQTPSRFHLGAWVAGDPSNAPGVIQWAGGVTDFTKLPYTAYVKSVNLEPASTCAYFNYTDKRGSRDSVKCLAELPKSLSSVVSSTALNTLSAAQPAPATTSNTISSSRASSSSSGRNTGGTTSASTAASRSTQASAGSYSSSRTSGRTTSTNTASNRSTQASSTSSKITGGPTSTNSANSSSTQASGSPGSVRLTTSTVYKTTVFSTVTSCNTAVTNCPANKPHISTVLVTDVVVDYTTVCPATVGTGQSSRSFSSMSSRPSSPSSNGSPVSSKGSSSGIAPGQKSLILDPVNRPVSQQSSASASSQALTSFHSGSGTVTGSHSRQDFVPSGSSATSGNSATGSTTQAKLTTSTVYSTNTYTVTSCGAEVKSCPARSTVLSTEVVVAYTTVCPVSSGSSEPSNGPLGPPSGNPSAPRPSDDALPASPSLPMLIPPDDGSQTTSPGNSSAPQPTDRAPAQSQSPLSFVTPKDGSQQQSSQAVSPGSPSAPVPSNSAPPPSSSTINTPEDGSQKQALETASSGNSSRPVPSNGPPSPSSSTLVTPKDGSERQSESMASSTKPSAPAPSSAQSSPHTIVSPNDAHDVPPPGSMTGSYAATTLMEYGRSSASLYNTDTELKASESSTPPAALPTDKSGDASLVAQNHAIPGTDSSQVAAEHGPAAPPTEKGHTPGGQSPPAATPGPDGSAPASAPGARAGEAEGDSHSSTGLAQPMPAGGSHVASTTRSTITRTKTVKLTSTRQSTSTLYSTSATVITNCAPGKSGAECSAISSTTTMVISKLVTPVVFTTTDAYATTETIDVAPADSGLSSAGAQGGSGVAGAGTGTGQQPAGAKTTTLATIAGARRAFEAVPGVLLALAMGVFFL